MTTVTARYQYRAVAGAGAWGEPGALRGARQLVRSLRIRYPDAEVERSLAVGCGRRYWRWRNRRWSLQWHTDPTPADLARWEFAPSIAKALGDGATQWMVAP